MSNLMGFGDVVLDLDRVVMVMRDKVLMNFDREGLDWYGVGEKAADAIRSYFTPASGTRGAEGAEGEAGTTGTTGTTGTGKRNFERFAGPVEAEAAFKEQCRKVGVCLKCRLFGNPDVSCRIAWMYERAGESTETTESTEGSGR